MRYAILLLFCSTASAGELAISETAWQVLNLADAYSTTQNIRRGNEEYGQWKIVCGSHPDTLRIWETAALWGAGHFAITMSLEAANAPKWVKRTWQYVTIGATGITVARNFR